MKKQIVTTITALLIGSATALADLQAVFDSDLEGWGATPGATINWVEVDSNGYAEASFTNDSPWYFEAPAAWLGDWSDYRQLKWDLIIASGSYADSITNNIVIIEGANGSSLVWNGSSPYWAWTHYEVPLKPAYFGSDQATFDSVITNVSALKILGEYKGGSEDVGLDNVLLTTNAPVVHTVLESTFDWDTEGWRPHDDVTLTHVPTNGNPGGYLHGLDWVDGRHYRFMSPTNWSGDWSAFVWLDFDLKIIEGGTGLDDPTLWIRGANGEVLEWNGPDPNTEEWTSYHVYLSPETFGVAPAAFDAVMGHVNEILILGEYRSGAEQEGLDNVRLSTDLPPVLTSNLVSTFDADLEGWQGANDIIPSWSTNGNPGGCYHGEDEGAGSIWHFVSPTAWNGDWHLFKQLRFQAKSVSGSWSFGNADMVRIKGWNGLELVWNGNKPHRLWTQYAIPLTPESFGADTNTFLSVISNVKGMWILGEVGGGGSDEASLDNVELLVDSSVPALPGRANTFDSGAEGWWDGRTGFPFMWQASGGNPGGYIEGDDGGSESYWHFHSPETWIGDWRHYQSLGFDFRIVLGSNDEFNEPTFQIRGANNETLSWYGPEPDNTWTNFAVNLSPALFGVEQVAYDAVMENVVSLRIRGEYVSGGNELEGIDNVFLSTSALGDPGSPVLAVGYDGTNVLVQFQTETNITYQLQASSNLVEGVGWEDVPGESLIGDGGVGVLEYGTAPPERFLRLRLE